MTLANYLPKFMRRGILKVDRILPTKADKASVSKEVIEKLYKVYEEENEKLFELINRRVDAWKFPESDKLS